MKTTSQNKMKTLKAKIEVLAELEEKLNDMLQSSPFREYKPVGKTDKQRRHWQTDELMFDDDGNPVYEDKWDYVTIPEEELDDKAKVRREAIMLILEDLDTLLK